MQCLVQLEAAPLDATYLDITKYSVCWRLLKLLALRVGYIADATVCDLIQT